MELTTRDEEYCKMTAHYVADTETVQKKREEIIDQIMKQNPRIPGYRVGKAPAQVYKHKYKKIIDKNLKQALVANAYEDIVYEKKIKPIGYPNVKTAELFENQFWCELIFHKKPEFELKEYKGLEIPTPHVSETLDQQIEAEIQKLRIEKADLAPYSEEDIVELNDKLTMDIKFIVDDQSETKEGQLYVVGSNIFPEFDDNILGHKAGDTFTFKVKMKDDDPVHPGKEGVYEVTIHMGLKITPAPLDDSLATRLGLNSYQELRTKISALVSNRMENQKKNNIAQQIAKRLIEAHDFEVPTWLVDAEAKNMMVQFNTSLDSLPEAARNSIMDQARDNVKYSLILDSIREAEPAVNFSESELINILKNKMNEIGQPNIEETIKSYMKNGQLFSIIASLRNQMVVDYIVDNSKLID